MVVRFFLMSLLLFGAGCASPVLRVPRVLPPGSPDLAADRARCLAYAERFGVISLAPLLGNKAQNQPDRRRQNYLFLMCMQEKGYRF
ncbi:hypothetical protein [Geopsychrobacter electrodiphilus]|uniref:hypothetical protein n=1 Tax=Geopsychrobacter electrodiphilus TaxID=225196 RepID=UPI0003738C5D|nr:hypothetical protein [Geopsychrobacter electrodiphilus]